MIILNFNQEAATFILPGKQKLRPVFNSASSLWAGPASDQMNAVSPGDTLQLQPQSVIILEI
jgi:hypothetical protein